MTFRIRRSDYDGSDLERYRSACEANDKIYRKHLEDHPYKDSDLWKFFYWDTFHDGHISKIVLWGTPGDISFHINCYNIKKRKGNTFEFLTGDIQFECHFRNVVHFSFDRNSTENLIFNTSSPLEFLYSEIDTLTEIIEKKKIKGKNENSQEDFDFHSLIIEVFGDGHSFFIEMVFSQVDVWPKEPIAFELMQQSEDFDVPIYRADQDIENLPGWATNFSDK